MQTFDYKAKDQAGNTVTGTMDAADERGAAAMIREMGYLPMDIRPARPPRVAKEASPEAGSAFARYVIYPLWTGVNLRTLAFFYRQLATLLSSGMSLSEALRSVGSRTGGRLGRIIGEARNNVQSGGPLSATMSRYPRVFSHLQISLIRAGEAGGLLEPMVERIASYLEHELSIRRLIAKMLAYPVMIFVFIVLVATCLPHLPMLVNEGFGPFAGAVWPGLRVWLLWVAAAIIVMKLLFQFRPIRLIWDLIKVQPPILGTMARKVAMSRFSRALAVLYSAGVPIAESVGIAAEACGNLSIGGGIGYAVPAIQSGHGMTESLSRTGTVMPIVLDMLTTGEKTGSMDSVLLKVADYMDEEVDATIHKTGIALFVLMILVAGGVVLRILVAFYSGYFSNILDKAGG